MVGPTNLNPRAPSSFEILIETGVEAGTLAVVLNWLTYGLAVDEVPQEFGEARAFFHDLQIGLGAVDGAFDLGAVAHDAGIVHQRVDFLVAVARDLFPAGNRRRLCGSFRACAGS